MYSNFNKILYSAYVDCMTVMCTHSNGTCLKRPDHLSLILILKIASLKDYWFCHYAY